jgi:hypothetical protein
LSRFVFGANFCAGSRHSYRIGVWSDAGGRVRPPRPSPGAAERPNILINNVHRLLLQGFALMTCALSGHMSVKNALIDLFVVDRLRLDIDDRHDLPGSLGSDTL